MSNIHTIIRVEGGHDSFFSSEKHRQIIDAINEIVQMSQARADELKKDDE